MTRPVTDHGLVRAIGLGALTASIVNTTVGAGIFVLPANVAGSLGSAAPWAYIVCAALMALIVICFASAGSRVSLTGGLYAYIEVAFGPLVGFLGGVLYWLMASFAVASVASAFAGSIAAAWPAAAAAAVRTLLLIALFGSLAFVNIAGVRRGAGLVAAVTIAKLLPLAVFVAAGFWALRGQGLFVTAPASAASLGSTSLLLIFAFVGVEVALVPSGEVRDPARTVPRALFLALALTTTLYVCIQLVAQGLLGAALKDAVATPLADAAARALGPAGRQLVLIGGIVSMFGYVSGDMLGTPRALYAFARDGIFPAALARVHDRFRTPHMAIATHALIVAVLAATGSFASLAILANVAVLLLYLLCVAAAYELQRRDVRSGGTPFAVPAGPVVPIAAAGVIIWLLSHATVREFAIEAVVLAAAALLYAARRGGSRAGRALRAEAAR